MNRSERARARYGAFLDQLKDRQGVVAGLIALITPLLLTAGVKNLIAPAIALGIALALLGAIGLIFWMIRNRGPGLWSGDLDQADANGRGYAAFRGLLAYTRSDTLPGDSRRLLARRIATAVADPGFRYGLVSGEVGSGKTSILDSGITPLLEQNGYRVFRCRGLQSEVTTTTLSATIGGLRDALRGIDSPTILIIDQFEEMLIAYRTPADRQALGAFLAEPEPGREIRVLCAVRSDYLIALYDLAPALADPLAATTFFAIKNLGEDEAANIILECSIRDGLEIEQRLAQMIAGDLARGGEVRPPELQLVCTALEMKSPERNYRERGGAVGILSGHVRDTIHQGPAPEIAASILRALCNFEAIPAAKTRPQTAPEIAALVETGDLARVQLVLEHLERRRLVAKIAGNEATTFTLIHDYLVEPVAVATSHTSTQTERANQLLRLHLNERASDRRSRIPLRRLLLIRRFADRDLLASSGARKLMRRSWVSAGIFAAGAAAIVMGCVALFAVIQSVQSQWLRTDLQVPDTAGGGVAQIEAFGNDRVVMVHNYALADWDPRNARKRLQIDSSDEAVFTRDGAIGVFQMIGDGGRRSRYAILSAKRKLRQTGIEGTAFDNVELSPGGDVLVQSDRSTDQIRFWQLSQPHLLARLETGEASNLRSNVNATGSLALVYNWGREERVRLISLRSSARQQLLLPQAGMFRSVAVTRDGSRFFLLAHPAGAAYTELRAHDFNSGALQRVRHIGLPEASSLYLLPGDTFIVASTGESGEAVLLRVSDLTDARTGTEATSPITVLGSRQDQSMLLAWKRPDNSTVLFEPDSGTSITSDLSLESIERSVVSRDASRLVIHRVDSSLELWNMENGQRIALPGLSGKVPVQGSNFSMNGQLLGISSVGGPHTVYDSGTGKEIAQFTNLGWVRATYYDASCPKIVFWTAEGQVVQFVRGRDWPLVGFRPIAAVHPNKIAQAACAPRLQRREHRHLGPSTVQRLVKRMAAFLVLVA